MHTLEAALHSPQQPALSRSLLYIRVCPPSIHYTVCDTGYHTPSIVTEEISCDRRVANAYNKSIAGIAHCKYPALVLLFYLASLQPPFKFLRAVRAASLSVTYGPTLFILISTVAYRHRRCGTDTRDLLFSVVGKITLAHRHRRLRSR
jgi:hypothetical protein